MGLYSQAGDKAKKKIQRIIENFDNGYNQLVYDKYNIPLNSQCRLFTEFMCKDQQMFKDSSDFVGYVENYLMSNSRHVVNDQEVKLLICLHDYILGVNTYPSVEKFYQLESNRARTNNNPTPTE